MQDVLDVHEAARALVDEVLALARAVHAPRDSNLVEVDGEYVVGVVEHERHLGDAHGLARGRSREDDVLHRLAAQLLGALLSEHPQNGVGDVRLTRTVRADDDGEPGLEGHVRTVGEGLEPF